MKLDIRRTIRNKPYVVQQMIKTFIVSNSVRVKKGQESSTTMTNEEIATIGYNEWNRWLKRAQSINTDITEEQFAVMLKKQMMTKQPWKYILENEDAGRL